MNELKLELMDVRKLVPSPKNFKKHPAEQIEALAKIFRTDGFDQPIVVDFELEIIKGHGRRLAVIHNGDHHGGNYMAPVFVRRDLTKEQADRARITDNAGVSTDYDMEAMQAELKRLAGLEVELDGMGLSDRELEFLSADLGEMTDEVFVEDIAGAVEQQREQNAEKASAVDGTTAPVGDALGFKRVTVEQSRKIREFMAAVESRTRLKGVEAFLAYIGGKV